LWYNKIVAGYHFMGPQCCAINWETLHAVDGPEYGTMITMIKMQ